MRKGYVVVGKDDKGKLLVTAEDPRQMTAITDPADPLPGHRGAEAVLRRRAPAGRRLPVPAGRDDVARR
jgi:hypothetical protein